MTSVPLSEEVENRIQATFSGEVARESARSMLLEYQTEAWHGEVERVRIGILRICQGHLERMRRLVDVAKRDYRDLLMLAEYLPADSSKPVNLRDAHRKPPDE
ncbi:hypothetical protein AB4Y89_06300 [Terriglobus sp. 2YAB30_2]|uniref:hypothetical protein n=1 Tax=unclassified Terriglobus TaxID=2628988 RepID=UPI003F997F47